MIIIIRMKEQSRTRYGKKITFVELTVAKLGTVVSLGKPEWGKYGKKEISRFFNEKYCSFMSKCRKN